MVDDGEGDASASPRQTPAPGLGRARTAHLSSPPPPSSLRLTKAPRRPSPTVSGTPPLSPSSFSARFFSRSLSRISLLHRRRVALDEIQRGVAGHTDDDTSGLEHEGVRGRSRIAGRALRRRLGLFAKGVRRLAVALSPPVELDAPGRGAFQGVGRHLHLHDAPLELLHPRRRWGCRRSQPSRRARSRPSRAVDAPECATERAPTEGFSRIGEIFAPGEFRASQRAHCRCCFLIVRPKVLTRTVASGRRRAPTNAYAAVRDARVAIPPRASPRARPAAPSVPPRPLAVTRLEIRFI